MGINAPTTNEMMFALMNNKSVPNQQTNPQANADDMAQMIGG